MTLHRQTVCSLISLLLVVGGAQEFGPSQNEIVSFPGYDGAQLPSRQYGGYITVPATQKQLFYMFVLSEGNPAADPLVLWLNGGPGCSSIGGGYIEEHGPFNYQPYPSTGSLLYTGVNVSANAWSWSKAANMLYIDSPAGTGLSFSTEPSDYTTDDFQATQDAYHALLSWFQTYPSFQSHNFYITGESYAGIYVPLVASLILNGNAASAGARINLQGIAIGNPSTDGSTAYNLNGVFEGFNLIPPDLYAELGDTNCQNTLTNFNESTLEGNSSAGLDVERCNELLDQVNNNVQDVCNYDINQDCFWGQQTFNAFIFNQTRDRLAEQGIEWQETLDLYQPLDDYCDYDDRVAHTLLNDPVVRSAIHAGPFANESQSLAGFFEMCTSRVNYTTLVESTLPYHQRLIEQGVRVLVYSGDHDTVVDTAGTRLWTTALGNQLGTVAGWRPWYLAIPDSFGLQVGGYLTQYNGLDFLTIRSSGHQVPTHKPQHAYEFFTNWLAGTLNATTATPDSFVLTHLFPHPSSEPTIAISAAAAAAG